LYRPAANFTINTKIVGIGKLSNSIFHNTTTGIIQMKLTSFLATTILLGTVVTSTVSLPTFTSNRSQVSAQEIKKKLPKLLLSKASLVVEIYSANYIQKISIQLAFNQVEQGWWLTYIVKSMILRFRYALSMMWLWQ
jgi:hypothetical protein